MWSTRRLPSLLFGLLLVGAALGLRWPHLGRQIWNLDEGVTFTAAQQVLDGELLYRDSADHRSPLVPYLKAAILAVAGDWNASAVHGVLAVLLGGCALALWRMSRRLGDEIAGVAAALAFTVLSFTLLDSADAAAAGTGWFLVVFSSAGFAAFAWSLGAPRFLRGLLSGLFFGGALACKQPGLLDLGAAWVVLILVAMARPGERAVHLKLGVGMAAGALLPVLGFALYFSAEGAFHDFIYYAFTYNTDVYVPEVPFFQRWAGMLAPFHLAWRNAPAALLLGVGGAGALLYTVSRAACRRPKAFPVLPWLILGWTASGLVSTGLSGRTFSHYSSQLIPGLSLACGWLIARLISWARSTPAIAWKRWGVSVAVGAVAVAFVKDTVHRTNELGPDDLLPRDVGRLVASHTVKGDRILVWGYYPELHFFARRLPATRFLYSNFITGMIPWTNLDPLVDTRYAAVPGAWEQLAADIARHPPDVILDTGGSRGYLKYPLHDQALLWTAVRRDYAEVAVGASSKGDMRLFRRLEPATGATLEPSLRVDDQIAVGGFNAFRRNEPPRIQVVAPPGARRIELFAAGHWLATLSHPVGQPVNVVFFANPGDVRGRDIRVVVTTAAGRSASRPFDFFAYAGRLAVSPRPGPSFKLGDLKLSPVALDESFGVLSPSPERPDTWRVDAPTTLEYPCPPGLAWVSFIHGPYEATQGKSDGYDLQVVMCEDSGAETLLHQRRMLPRTIGADRREQAVSLRLPPHGRGRLIFRFTAGLQNQPDFDWIYFGQLHGDADGPLFLMGDQPVLPSLATTGGGQPMKRLLSGRWMAHAPAMVEWERPPNLTALTLSYGMEEGAYTAPEGHSDGVDLTLEFVESNGTRHSLFSTSLTPFNHPEHRGPQASRVEVPPGIFGKLHLSVSPGPRGDASWDWAWLGPIVCEGPGPNIVVSSSREIMPVSSRVVDARGGPSKRDSEFRWGAHADAELVYDRPADLEQVTFEYGLAEGADRDEKGKRRSDGVEVVVEFLPATGGEPRELFRRPLDPFHHSADAALHRSTLDLPAYEAGRLIFRITPGPSGNNAFDWGVWGRFTGKSTP